MTTPETLKEEKVLLSGKALALMDQSGRIAPVQDFLGGEVAEEIISKITGKGNSERTLAYWNKVVSTWSEWLVGKLLDFHHRSLVAEYTRQNANSLDFTVSKAELLKRANESLNIAPQILAILEPFIFSLINTDLVSDSLFPSKIRNDFAHALKSSFLSALGSSNTSMSDASRIFFVRHLKQARSAIHPNHPVRAFISTVLYELEGNPNFLSSGRWTGFAATLDDKTLGFLPNEVGGNCFWLASITAPRMQKKIHFYENALFYSQSDKWFSANDEDRGFKGEKNAVRAVFSDNAGAYSFSISSLDGTEVHLESEAAKALKWSPGKRDVYLWPFYRAKAYFSFKNSKISAGFKDAECEVCFNNETEFLSPGTRDHSKHPLNGAKLNSCAKNSFVHRDVVIAPREISEGTFDDSILMSNIESAINLDSLKNAILFGDMPEPKGKPMTIPALGSKWLPNKACERLVAFWKSVLFGIKAAGGFFRATVANGAGERAEFSMESAQETLFYNACENGKLTHNAWKSAYIHAGSFSWRDAMLSGCAAEWASVSRAFQNGARISGMPLSASLHVSRKEAMSKALSRLGEKAASLIKDVKSSYHTLHGIIQNSIASIPFEKGAWNIAVSGAQAEKIRQRLNKILREEVLSASELWAREELERAMSNEKMKDTIHAEKMLKRLERKKDLQLLEDDPEWFVASLVGYPKRELLLDPKNWEGLEVPERVIAFALEKIEKTIREYGQEPIEKARTVAILAIGKVLQKFLVSWLQSWTQMETFHDAVIETVEEGFWKECEKHVGVSRTKILREKIMPVKGILDKIFRR